MLYADDGISFLNLRFENDVKVDGTQTEQLMYLGIGPFENDVKVDGTQTNHIHDYWFLSFENDVKVDGTQTFVIRLYLSVSLRMM